MTAALATALNVPVPKEVEQSIYSQEETINQPQPDSLIVNDLPTILSTANATVPTSTSDTNPPIQAKTQVAVPSSSTPKAPSSSRRRNNPLLITLIAMMSSVIRVISRGLFSCNEEGFGRKKVNTTCVLACIGGFVSDIDTGMPELVFERTVGKSSPIDLSD